MKDDHHVTYGFGRRVCIGKHVANSSLFISFAMMMWACTIEPRKDENGSGQRYDASRAGLVV